MTEKEVLNDIRIVGEMLSTKFSFAYYDREDIEQEVFILASKALSKYDDSKGASLQTFLYTVVQNGLKNLKRDKYQRLTADPISQKQKKNLLEPVSICRVNDEKESSMQLYHDISEKADNDEIFDIIDTYLPTKMNMRQDYLKMINSVSIPKPRRDRVIQAIKEILSEHGYEVDFGQED